MKNIISKSALCSATIVAAIFASGQENLIKNGNLENIEKGKFIDWKHGAGISSKKEGNNNFARIANKAPNGYVGMSQDFEIKPDWEGLAVSVKMRVNSLNQEGNYKPGEVPRAMIIFSTTSNQKHYRPLCHIADQTDGKWLLRYETVEIVPDAKTASIVLDLSGPTGEFDVDDIAVYANPGKIYPIELLEYAGKFDYRRTMRMDNPPGWSYNYSMTQMDKPTIRIERENNSSFLRVENNDPNQILALENIFRIDPSWKKVKVSAKIRAKNLRCGSQVWQNARVMITFTNSKGDKVGGYGECPEAKSDQDWKEVSVEREVPEDAAGIRLQVGLFNATGIADFDDIKVSPAN